MIYARKGSLKAYFGFQAAAEPKELCYVKGTNHTDMYDSADKIPFAKLVEFYRASLK